MTFGLLVDERDHSTALEFQPCDFTFKVAESEADLEKFWHLRREIFCEEQGVFQGSDADCYDREMIPIICTTLIVGMEDTVVGAVRIDERAPGVWWGSRLCVHRDFRRVRAISSAVPIRNHQPSFYSKVSIGAGLIYKAVSTAHGLGCHVFLAHVQRRNRRFFRRLHWKALEEVELHGMVHVKMQADLGAYPPPEDRLFLSSRYGLRWRG
jgi:hypothetical protein